MCKNEAETTTLTSEQKLYQERLNRVETAIHLGTPDKVPVFAFFSSYMQRAYGSSYADIYYDFDKAGQAAVQFHKGPSSAGYRLIPSIYQRKSQRDRRFLYDRLARQTWHQGQPLQLPSDH